MHRPHAAVVAMFALVTANHTGAASAQPDTSTTRTSTTRHVGVFNGQSIGYTATVADTIVHSATGAPAAAVVTISYVRDGTADLARRPILFCFNGGPGASSSPLHTQALGPMIRAAKPGTGFRDNPTSPLDATDLVFIDPVGTGFSRPLPGVDPKPFYDVSGDAREVAEVIETWLKQHDRQSSPRYIMGESYGTLRALALVKTHKELHLAGVLLVALAASPKGDEMPFVTALPTMAAGAWFHGKVDRRGDTTPEAIFNRTRDYARSTYVTALIEGSSLPKDEKLKVAQQLSDLVGLPADLIVKDDLRITKNDWMFNLLKSQGLRTGLLDVRVTAPLEPGAIGDIDDPALGVAPKRAPGAHAGPPPSPASIGPVPSPAVGDYLTHQLEFPASGPYIGINFTANSLWTYEGHDDDMQALGTALRADPRLRLFWAAGYYDLTTPAYAGRYALDQAGVPAAQLTAVYFAGPHGVYDGDENRARFDAAVRAFVAPSPS